MDWGQIGHALMAQPALHLGKAGRGVRHGLEAALVRIGMKQTPIPFGLGDIDVVKRLCAAWPQTRIVLRGDAHFANPELMQLAVDDPNLDFIFGLAGNRALSPLAESFLTANRQGDALRVENARRTQRPLPTHTRTYHEIAYVAASCRSKTSCVRSPTSCS